MILTVFNKSPKKSYSPIALIIDITKLGTALDRDKG